MAHSILKQSRFSWEAQIYLDFNFHIFKWTLVSLEGGKETLLSSVATSGSSNMEYLNLL